MLILKYYSMDKGIRKTYIVKESGYNRVEIDQRSASFNISQNATEHSTCIENEKCEQQQRNTIFDEKVLYETVQNYHNSFRRWKTDENCLQRTPQCIIIGVKKCGTRELIDFMAIHPNIVIKRKPSYEINYFLKPLESLKWYRSRMPCSYSDQITVTKSPLYFSNPFVPERLCMYNESLKMIVLVREPIQRLLSAVSFEYFKTKPKLMQDLSKLPPMDAAIVDHVTGSVNRLHLEVKLSTYDTAMQRYLKYFTRDQIMIIETNELKNNPAKVLKEVEKFLGLKHVISENMFVFNIEKKHHCLKRQNGGMACYGIDRGRTVQKQLQNNTIQILKRYFAKHNENFFRLINKRFDWNY